MAAEQPRCPAEQLGEDRRHGHAAGERVVVASVGAERVVVLAQRSGNAGRHRLLADAEVGRPADQALEEQLLGTDLELPALDHRPVHPEARVAIDVGRGRLHAGGS